MKQQLNIWTVYQFASTPKIPGSERTFQFAKAFARRGHHVTLWTSSFSHWGKVETIKDNNASFIKEREDDVSVISLKTRPLYLRNNYKRFLNMIYFAYAFFRQSRDESPKPDVIIASYPSPFAAVAAYLLSLRYKAKFILEIRDLWPQVWIEKKAYSPYHPFILILRFLEHYLYKRTRYFVTVLPYADKYLLERGARPAKISWIPNGVNLEEFETWAGQGCSDAAASATLERMSAVRKNGNLIVLYLGGLGVGNRVDHILQAAKLLREEGENGIAFFIVGEGHSKDSLVRYKADNRLDSVNIFSAIPRSCVPTVLNTADAGILCLNDNPIYRYGVNLHKVFDYMAAGLPIVFAADVKNDMVASSQGGITVKPGDIVEIVNALRRLKGMSPDERRAMGKKGYEYLSASYDIGRQLSKKYMDLIRSN